MEYVVLIGPAFVNCNDDKNNNNNKNNNYIIFSILQLGIRNALITDKMQS